MVAGCVTRTTTSPLDVLKILVQVHRTDGGIQNTIKQLYSTRGIFGFWKGNLAGCCRLGPYSAIKFCLYDQLQDHVAHNGNPASVQRATCGAVAGMAATLAVYPMELVRTHLIVAKQTTSIANEFRAIFQTEGIRGLYRGCLVGLVGAIPFEGIQFGCYEYGKDYAVQHRWPQWRWPEAKTQLDTIDHFVLGSGSGALAQLFAYPFDTVKKRLQMQAKDGVVRYSGIGDCFVKIIRQEGTVGLYRGSLPNMVRLVP
ncbi:hypothetical protein As57867_003249, partial [Aphanomyces stellatus]